MEKEPKEKKVLKMSLGNAILILVLLLMLLAVVVLLGISILKPRLANENLNNVEIKDQEENNDTEDVENISYKTLKTKEGIIVEYPNDKKWNWNQEENGQYILTVERNRRKGSYYI